MSNIKKQCNFITFEGIDGCGKTTQSKMLAEYLNKVDIKTLWTREVGGTDCAEKIRDILINNDLDNVSELFLIMAARKEHIKHLIKPSISNNLIVVCDRYIDSSAAYQAINDLTLDMIYDLHEKYLENLMPSITFYIDISYKDAKTRIDQRAGNDRYDYLGEKFFEQIKENYEQIIKKFPKRFVRIEGARDSNEVHKEILKIIAIEFSNRFSIRQ